MHPDIQELVPLLVNQASYALIKKKNYRKALKKLKRLQVVLQMENRKPIDIIGITSSIVNLLK